MSFPLIYPLLKMLHMTFALISVISLVFRVWWFERRSPENVGFWLKVGPHINNALLLISAFALAGALGLSPHSQPWLMSKLILLVVYIGLGVVALKPKFSLRVRITATVAAVLVFLLIAHIAVAKMGLLAMILG